MINTSLRTGMALLASLLVLSGCGSVAPDCNGLTVNSLWVREAPPGAGAQAGYFDATNPTSKDIKLVAIESQDFERVEMHETIRKGGSAHMERIESVVVPPIASMNFRPGGKHLMLFSPRLEFRAGDRVEIVFVCGEERARYPMVATIRRERG